MSKKDKHKGYKVVIVPENGRDSKTYSFTPFRFFMIRTLIVLFVLSFVVFIAFFGTYFSAVDQLASLKSENQVLAARVEKMDDIEENIVEMDQYIRYIRFAMSLSGDEQPPLLEEFAANDSLKKSYELSAQSSSYDQIPNILPVIGFVSKTFSEDEDHFGIDYSASEGTQIRATANGLVTGSYYDEALGNVLEIDHGNGYKTKFAHCSEAIAVKGNTVLRGEMIATVGNSGTATNGAHLHYEVTKDGVPVNPELLIN